MENKIKREASVKKSDTFPTDEALKKAPEQTSATEKKATSSATLLKNYAVSNKKTSATFKDLGERKNGQKTEYAVECSFLGETTVGTGTTRTDARETACKLMAEKIGIGKKKKTTKAKNKAAAKPKPAQKPDLIAKQEAKNNDLSIEKTAKALQGQKKAFSSKRKAGKKQHTKKTANIGKSVAKAK